MRTRRALLATMVLAAMALPLSAQVKTEVPEPVAGAKPGESGCGSLSPLPLPPTSKNSAARCRWRR